MEFDQSHAGPQPGHYRLGSTALEPLMTRDYELRPDLVYYRLRQKYGPVAPVDLMGVPVWLVVGYGEALQVLQDAQRWPKGLQNWRAYSEGRIPKDWPLLPSLEVNHLLIQDGPNHRTLRLAWDAALRPFQDPTQRAAGRLSAAVSGYANELISLVAQGGLTGMADLSAQFSRPLPLMAASHLLGYPQSQGDDALMDMWTVLDAGPDAGPALDRLLASLIELGASKRKRPGDDFPSYLLAAHPDLDLEDLSRELMLMLGMVADHTGVLMSNAVVEVLTGDGAGHTGLSAGFIRETMNRVAMRKPPHINLAPRFPWMDTRLGNYVIAAGDPVVVSVAGAHTDPQFAGSDDTGALTSTRAHLSWGAGPRQCPSRELASSIAATGLTRLFANFTRLELTTPADDLPWRSSPLMRGPRSIPVRYDMDENYPAARALASSAGAAAGADSGRRRSSLWRYLGGLVRGR